MRKLRLLGLAAALAALLAAAALLTGYGLLRGALPRLDGELRVAGLAAPVRITRDWRGVPTIEAASRADLAYATGFLHAQDRFFQMDLARRHAAGELAELFGAVALAEDRRTRLFRFRTVAREVLTRASAPQRELLEAYTRGVNAGLASLAVRPWEYWVLRQAPAAWRAEDTLLVEYAMWWDLQAGGFPREILRRTINARLGGPRCADGWQCALGFFYPLGTSWDALVAPGAQPPPAGSGALPDATVLDVRGHAHAAAAAAAGAPREPAQPAAGSNAWAVGGHLTATGAALVANDMHLGLRVPPVWYHARLKMPAAGSAAALDLNGVTLPGTPVLIAGSNGRIAWGFTNSYGDWLSVERTSCSAVRGDSMTTPAGDIRLAVVREEIRVRGAAPALLEVRSAPAGVLLEVDADEHVCWFGAWLAQLPEATNINLMELEHAGSVAEALALAPSMGMPHQNAVVGDAQGHIGWTIFGRIPEDTGASRAAAGAPWTTGADQPRIVDPPAGRIWTANARVTGDERQQRLIGGAVATLGAQYNLGARAGQIRDDLLGLAGPATPADMLRIQLDDRALFLARWRTLLLGLLDAPSLERHPQRAEFRQLVERWNAAASVDAVGYRLVRGFHDRTRQAVREMLLGALGIAADAEADAQDQFEGSLWQLVTQQPMHLLAARYADWPQFLRAQVDATIAELAASCPELARCTWGARNTVRIRHPLSRALSPLATLLDMPTLELPGDHDMPRVQDGTSFGASERFAVSPGHEEQGYLDIPGGQSGNPLSPYYRAGFSEWARGVALPFLPGPAEHTLTLTPG